MHRCSQATVQAGYWKSNHESILTRENSRSRIERLRLFSLRNCKKGAHHNSDAPPHEEIGINVSRLLYSNLESLVRHLDYVYTCGGTDSVVVRGFVTEKHFTVEAEHSYVKA